MTYFAINLRDGHGRLEKLGMLEFASLDEARSDVRAAAPDVAADLLRAGANPFLYALLVCDEGEQVLAEVPLTAALRDGQG